MTFNSSGILITVKGSVLLSKRIEKYKNKPVPFGGYWSPFSGMIEEGEDPKDCAIRELKEESGLDIEKSKGLLIAAGATAYAEFGKKHFLEKEDEIFIYIYNAHVHSFNDIMNDMCGMGVHLEQCSKLHQVVR